MTRTAPAGSSEEQTSAVWLLEVVFWNGSSEVALRMTTHHHDLTVDADGDSSAETYTGAGDFLSWDAVSETEDPRGQGVRFELSGVETTVISTLMNNDFRGRRVRLWRAKLDPETGAVDETYLYHRGVQLADYEASEQRPDDGPVTATITTRSLSGMTAIEGTNEVRTNVTSHNAMLARLGLPTGDSAFRYLPNIDRFFWGSEVPAAATDGSNSGASAGSGGGGRQGGGGPGDAPGGGPDTRFRP